MRQIKSLILLILAIAAPGKASEATKHRITLLPGVSYNGQYNGFEVSGLYTATDPQKKFTLGLAPVFGWANRYGEDYRYIELEGIVRLTKIPVIGFSAAAGRGELKGGDFDESFNQVTVSFWLFAPIFYCRTMIRKSQTEDECGVMFKVPIRTNWLD